MINKPKEKHKKKSLFKRIHIWYRAWKRQHKPKLLFADENEKKIIEFAEKIIKSSKSDIFHCDTVYYAKKDDVWVYFSSKSLNVTTSTRSVEILLWDKIFNHMLECYGDKIIAKKEKFDQELFEKKRNIIDGIYNIQNSPIEPIKNINADLSGAH